MYLLQLYSIKFDEQQWEWNVESPPSPLGDENRLSLKYGIAETNPDPVCEDHLHENVRMLLLNQPVTRLRDKNRQRK